MGGDIGSPGFVTAPPAKPSITEIKRVDATLSITWTSVAGKQYVIEGKDDLAAATWTTIRTTTAAGATTTETVPMDAGVSQRFFRVSAQ